MPKCKWLVMCFIHYRQVSDSLTKQYTDVPSLIGGMFLEVSSSFCLFLCVPKKQSVTALPPNSCGFQLLLLQGEEQALFSWSFYPPPAVVRILQKSLF